jgi:hypothetical protein
VVPKVVGNGVCNDRSLDHVAPTELWSAVFLAGILSFLTMCYVPLRPQPLQILNRGIFLSSIGPEGNGTQQ